MPSRSETHGFPIILKGICLCALSVRRSAGCCPFDLYVNLEVMNMSEVVSMSSNFTGPSGALVMSFISMSIVFLVIIGLMFVMKATNMIVTAYLANRSRKDPTGEGR